MVDLIDHEDDRAAAASDFMRLAMAKLAWSDRPKIDFPDMTRKGPRPKSQANVAALLNHLGVTVRYNSFTYRYVIEQNGQQRDMDEVAVRGLYFQAEQHGLQPPVDYFEQALMHQGDQNSFHPVRDYLDSLQWDGTERIAEWLHAYAGAANTPLNAQFGRLMLISAVRRVRQPGCKLDTLPVFEGPQDCGKSTMLRILAGDRWFTDAVTIGENAKEMIEKSAGSWILELAELAMFKVRDVDAVKAMLSRQSERARLAYGRGLARDYPRQFIMAATVNHDQYLRDATGNRRFWPIKVGKIDLESLRRDRDQLWAEAAYCEARGEPIVLPAEYRESAAAEQETRLVSDAWTEALAAVLPSDPAWIATDDCYAVLGIEMPRRDPSVSQRVVDALRKLKFSVRTMRTVGGCRKWGYQNVSKEQPAPPVRSITRSVTSRTGEW